jgi:hypothetical protein
MTNIISYMSITQGLSDNFFKTKKSLENDLKPLLETNGDIDLDIQLHINFYGIGGCNVNKIILGDGDSVLLCNEDNNIYQHITDICDIDDFYNLCKELGV